MNTSAVSDLFLFIYAHAAEYFPVTSYLFADTHSGADHKQVLLEMLNIFMRNSVIYCISDFAMQQKCLVFPYIPMSLRARPYICKPTFQWVVLFSFSVI